MAHACYVGNSHISWLRNSCCGEQAWQQVVGEEGVGEVVGLPLGFVAVLGFLEGDGHDSGVVDEAVEFFLFGSEFFCCGHDGGEVHVIEDEEVDVCIGDGSFDGSYCGVSFCCRTTAYVHRCVFEG